MERASTVLLFIGSLYAAFFLLERRWPLRPATRKLLPRLLVNAAMSLLALATSAVLVQPVVSRLIDATGETGFGLFRAFSLPSYVQLVLAFLLLDLSFYYWHRLNHRWAFLWRFHNVHHIDPDLDVSTGFRFHPGEVALSTGFRAIQVTLLGVGGWTFLAYEAVFQAGTLFHHSNLRLPARLERALNLVFVTPRMHGLHHSVVRGETNSNYSVVFSFWDRLHRSLTVISTPQRNVGVPGYSRPSDNALLRLVKAPFEAQRPYWE